MVPVDLIRAGRMGYQAAWDLQRSIHSRVLDGAPSTLILCSHDPVYSLGRQTRSSHIPLSAGDLNRMGAEVIETDRGGSVTWHGPGQLVGYPIFRLGDFTCGEDLHVFLRMLEEALIRGVGRFGVTAERVEGKTGIWTPGGKLAAIGLKCSRWVTMHGFALNVNPDLDWFSHVVPCGLTEPVTSLAKLLGTAPEDSAVESAVLDGMSEVFACQLHDSPEPAA